MTNSLIVMLGLPNFIHMTTFTIWLESPDEILFMTSSTELMTS